MDDKRHGIYNTRAKKSQRRSLRNASTTAEAVLWKSLKGRQILGRRFRRQFSIGPYIVDFYCPECRLAVELDGAPHFTILAHEYEERRARYLVERGVKVIRFENKLVFRELEHVLDVVRDELQSVCE